jgi:hypothetical protein
MEVESNIAEQERNTKEVPDNFEEISHAVLLAEPLELNDLLSS